MATHLPQISELCGDKPVATCLDVNDAALSDAVKEVVVNAATRWLKNEEVLLVLESFQIDNRASLAWPKEAAEKPEGEAISYNRYIRLLVTRFTNPTGLQLTRTLHFGRRQTLCLFPQAVPGVQERQAQLEEEARCARFLYTPHQHKKCCNCTLHCQGRSVTPAEPLALPCRWAHRQRDP